MRSYLSRPFAHDSTNRRAKTARSGYLHKCYAIRCPLLLTSGDPGERVGGCYQRAEAQIFARVSTHAPFRLRDLDRTEKSAAMTGCELPQPQADYAGRKPQIRTACARSPAELISGARIQEALTDKGSCVVDM